MTSPILAGRPKPALPRRVHLVMRDATMIEGQIQIGEDQSIVSFLNGRRGGWMSLTQARRPKLEEPAGHMIVQSEHIVIASAPDGNAQISTGASAAHEERGVEIVLVGGKTVHGHVSAAARQRLSDFISASGRFIGFTRATLMPEARALGDIALNTSAMEIVRDLKPGGPEEGGGDA